VRVDVDHRAIPQRVFQRRCVTDIQPLNELVGWRGDWNLKSRFSLRITVFRGCYRWFLVSVVSTAIPPQMDRYRSIIGV